MSRIKQRRTKDVTRYLDVNGPNPYQGIIFSPLSGLFAAYANKQLVGHYLALSDAQAARDAYTAEEQTSNAY